MAVLRVNGLRDQSVIREYIRNQEREDALSGSAVETSAFDAGPLPGDRWKMKPYGDRLPGASCEFSIVVPYYNRLAYIERVLRALADQDIGLRNFEIVIGCLEYSEPLLQLLAALPSELRARCIMTREPWNVSRARNLAIAHTEGEVLLLLDSDMLLPSSFLRGLRENYDLARNCCAVIPQMLNYRADTDVDQQRLSPYEYYKDTYLARNSRHGLGVDIRWMYQRRIPWSLCWTAVIAISRTLIEDHALYFDQSFTGWGAEDVEWGYRVHQSGIPIVFADDLWGIHLPHGRDARKNFAEQERNYDRFLSKWPCFDVEMVTRFGVLANQHFDELTSACRGICGAGERVNVVEFSIGGARYLALGAITDACGRLLNRDEIPDISAATIVRQVPLLGLRLPYPNRVVNCAYLLPSLRKAPEFVQDLIFSESERISNRAVFL